MSQSTVHRRGPPRRLDPKARIPLLEPLTSSLGALHHRRSADQLRVKGGRWGHLTRQA